MIIYKTLNTVPTSLIIHGDPLNSRGKDVIVCITGNPGIIDFYQEFSEELYKNTGLTVCVIGHAGHEVLLDKESIPLKGQEHLFNLDGQLNHKLDLLNNFLDNNCKLHFIGHSIGSWLLIELLLKNEHLYRRTSSINLLFPTIQRMSISKNGIWLNNIVRRLHSVVMLLFLFLNLLPETACNFIINVYRWFKGVPVVYNKRILKYINPTVIEKVLFLAYDEMDTVTALNLKGVEKIKHVTNVIYSSDDGWAPIEYMQDLEVYQPELQMKEVNMDHAFVIKSSKEVASMVSDFIKTKKSQS